MLALIRLLNCAVGLAFILINKSVAFQLHTSTKGFYTTAHGLKTHSHSQRNNANQLQRFKMSSSVETSNSDAVPVSGVPKFKQGLDIMYKFSRPHTIKGTILASFMGVVRALLENKQSISFSLIPRALIGLFALLCGNAYIVGINQIYDVKIDEINKPYLPIAAKRLSTTNAWRIVLFCLFAGVTIVKTQFSSFIFSLYMFGIVLGTSYSIPPFSFKGVPLMAGGIIACVRGFLLNFGVYYAVREALGIKFTWNPVVAFISSFMTVFATVIAITKDLSDIEGDKKYKIKTFASTYGVKAVAKVAGTVLSLAYLTAMALPMALPGMFNLIPMTLGHGTLLVYFLSNLKQFEPNEMSSVNKFYKVIWNLFYLEYCLYPFI